MATGYETLQDIERAIAGLRAKEEAIGRELEAANTRRTEVMRDRAGLVRELAVARARSAVADGVIDEADRLDGDVAMILAARQRSIEGARARQRELVERQKELLAESGRLHEEVAAREIDLDRLAEKARASLAGDAGWEAAVARVATLEAQREKAADKAAQAKADRDRKGGPYESDPLFLYLWRRDYRGAAYAPGGALVRWLDDWVAGLVRYNEARANYALLNEIPVRLAAHVERLSAEAASASAERDAIVARRMRDEAGDDIVAQLRNLRAASKDVDARLAACETELSEASSLLNRYAQGLDDSFRLAVETLAAFLEHQRYDRLVAEARTTAEPSDDVIVARIGEERRKAEDIDRTSETRRRELDDLARRREDLTRVAADFRRKSYHQPGSVFEPDKDLGPLLEAVVRGGLEAVEYWARTRQRQRWSSRAGDPYRRDSGFPPFDFDIGWGGGDRGGDSGGDDFRTGGGF